MYFWYLFFPFWLPGEAWGIGCVDETHPGRNGIAVTFSCPNERHVTFACTHPTWNGAEAVRIAIVQKVLALAARAQCVAGPCIFGTMRNPWLCTFKIPENQDGIVIIFNSFFIVFMLRFDDLEAIGSNFCSCLGQF